MAAKLTRVTHKVAIQLLLVAESCTICSSRARRTVRKLLDTHSYLTNIEKEKHSIPTAIYILNMHNFMSKRAFLATLLVPER